MKQRLLAITGLALSISAGFAAAEPTPLKEGKEKISYSIGMSIGSSLKAQGADVDPDVLVKGIRDTLAGKTVINEQEMRTTLMTWQTEIRNKRTEQQKVQGEKNKKEGEDFLGANAKKEGVVTLPSGLQYKVLASGKGKTPTTNDTVRAHYKGTLIDGTEFDSSYTRGQPFITPVTRVIKGWTEALTKMKVGDKWQLFIPPALAYGERGAGAKIGPNAALIFEMELLGIEEAKEPAAVVTPVQK
ncbi:MAG: FKBP-type peptidyl-prolyl cis-trans isomerase [Verrucomicrobia bacterium]|nr:FKBP-type peptidyl-prolyl cis-trans isomerase [Verrucomicrobiota bacterium]